MNTTRVSLITIALLLSHGASAEPPTITKDRVVGQWSGALVINAMGKQEVLPLQMTFRADGIVEVTPLGDGKVEKQGWSVDAAKRQLTFTKENGKVDGIVHDLVVTRRSLIGRVTPDGPAASKKDLTMQLYMGRLKTADTPPKKKER